jgi:hypothetical protein
MIVGKDKEQYLSDREGEGLVNYIGKYEVCRLRGCTHLTNGLEVESVFE